jgi:hypothetical protein
MKGGTVMETANIRKNAQKVIDRFGSSGTLGAKFGYNRDSVAWIDGFIEGLRGMNLTVDEVESWVQLIGSYLGECVIETYGGVWREQDGALGVFFNESCGAFPFNKVRKQFENGIEDSILCFFVVIPAICQIPHGPGTLC